MDLAEVILEKKLRDFFEIDGNHIVLNILRTLNKESEYQQFIKE